MGFVVFATFVFTMILISIAGVIMQKIEKVEDMLKELKDGRFTRDMLRNYYKNKI